MNGVILLPCPNCNNLNGYFGRYDSKTSSYTHIHKLLPVCKCNACYDSVSYEYVQCVNEQIIRLMDDELKEEEKNDK